MKDGKIERADVITLRLPKEFWRVTLTGVPSPASQPIGRYVRGLRQMRRDGVSLLFTGRSGTGKSSAAAVIVKTARAMQYTAYWRYAWQYREDRRQGLFFSAEETSFQRCMDVDFLVIDDFREEDAMDRYYGTHDLEGVLVSRAQNRKPTIITSSYESRDASVGLSRLLDKVPRMVQVVFTGDNLREADTDKYEKVLWGDDQ